MHTLHQASEIIKFSAEILGSTPPANGIYEINHVCGDKPHVFHTSDPVLQAHCSNGGWTVILRRELTSHNKSILAMLGMTTNMDLEI